MREFDFFEVLGILLWAARWTIGLSLVALIGGGIWGLILTFMRISPNRLAIGFSKTYINFFQGTPLLMQLFLVFFGLPILFGYEVSAWTAASVALIAYSGAFLADIWRGSVGAIPKEQWEAGTALGLSFLQQFRYVIAPQAIKLSIPPTVGFSVQVIKNTSLTSIIGFVELTRQTQILNNVTFRPFLLFGMLGIIYFALCYPLSLFSKSLEGKLTHESR